MLISPNVPEEERMRRIKCFKEDYGSFKFVMMDGHKTHMAVTENGIVINLRCGEIMIPHCEMSEFLSIVLEYPENGAIVPISRRLAKVVADTYLPNPTGSDSAVCKNGNWFDCSISNLAWGSRSDFAVVKKNVNLLDKKSIPKEKSYVPYCNRAIPRDLVGFQMLDKSANIPQPPFGRKVFQLARKGIITEKLYDFIFEELELKVTSDIERVRN